MTRTLLIFALATFAAAPAVAQGRRNNAQGIPPGHLPRAGECRVWYDGVPPGRQPAPTSCDNAERIASQTRTARVIYGDDRYQSGSYDRNGQWRPGDSRNRDGRPVTGRAVPRGSEYPGTYGYPDSRYPSQYPDTRYPSQRGAYGTVGFDNGYRDGLEKAREDTRDGDRYDPARHGWYKSANRGYNSRYGSRDDYAREYRDGFLQAYRETYRGQNDRGNWWPF